ncbi:MAG: glycosyltransferase family 2 protein [Planctomycetaceae bacterium]
MQQQSNISVTDNDGPHPRVSVVIAAYNYGHYIAQAIQSVVDQTFTDWELIIVDDESTDNTTQIVSPFLADPRIRYYRQSNQGQPLTENRGIELSRGELIAFLDADDAWLPGKLEKQVPLFDNNSRVGVTYTGVRIMDEFGRVSSTSSCKKLRGDVFKASFHQTIPSFSSSIVRKTVFDDVGRFDKLVPFNSDYEMWLRAAMKYHFDYVDEPLLLYRTGHANMSKQRYQVRRLNIVNYVIPHILNDCGGRARLTRKEIAEGYAVLFIGMGECDMEHSQWSSLRWYVRAVFSAPWMWPCWRGVIRSIIPKPIVSTAKRLIGTRVHDANVLST